MTVRASSPAPAGAEASSRGISPRTAALLAYLGWWVTGGLLLLLERDSPSVRFHAAQSCIGLGALWLVGLACWGTSFLAVFVATSLFQILMALAALAWATGVAAWLACLIQAGRGVRWQLPLVGPLATRIAART